MACTLLIGRIINAALHSIAVDPLIQTLSLLSVNLVILALLARWHVLFKEKRTLAIIIAMYIFRVLINCFLFIEVFLEH